METYISTIEHYIKSIEYQNFKINTKTTPLAMWKSGGFPYTGEEQDRINYCMGRIESTFEEIITKFDGAYKERLIEIIEILKNILPSYGSKDNENNVKITEITSEMKRILLGKQERYEKITTEMLELKKLREACTMINFIKKKQLDKKINECKSKRNKI